MPQPKGSNGTSARGLRDDARMHLLDVQYLNRAIADDLGQAQRRLVSLHRSLGLAIAAMVDAQQVEDQRAAA